MARFARMKTVTAVDVAVAELHVENIDELCIGQCTVINVFLEHIPQYRVVDIPYFGMERFPPDAV